MASTHPPPTSIASPSSPSESQSPPPQSSSTNTTDKLLDAPSRIASSQIVPSDTEHIGSNSEPQSFEKKLPGDRVDQPPWPQHVVSEVDIPSRVSSDSTDTDAPAVSDVIISGEVSPLPQLHIEQHATDSALAAPSDGSVPNAQGKPEQNVPGKSPKPAWGKASSNVVRTSESAAVMGALSWPALSEAKALESSKPAPIQRTSSKISSENPQLQTPSVTSKGNIGNLTNMRKQKLPNQQDSVNNGTSGSSVQAPQDTSPTNQLKNPSDVDHAENTEKTGRAVRTTNNGIGVNTRGNAPNSVSSNVGGNRRSFLRDQGRGNHGWHSHGRGYANGRDNNIPFQQQRVGPRNLPRPFFPYISPTPSFVNAVGYQSVPGNMYYMTAPPPDPLLGPTYFGPPAVQGVFMPGPDPTALQGMLVKQIEYYFSVENLCRDIYLRSNMDDQGFVPVSIIANFNRVRMITQNPYFILESLRTSNVVEVQGDRIRKREDWANWLLPFNQRSGVSNLPSDERDRIALATDAEQSRSARSGNQEPGHVNPSNLTGEMYDKNMSYRSDYQGHDQKSDIKGGQTISYGKLNDKPRMFSSSNINDNEKIPPNQNSYIVQEKPANTQNIKMSNYNSE